jgi:hypothetical protein
MENNINIDVAPLRKPKHRLELPPSKPINVIDPSKITLSTI